MPNAAQIATYNFIRSGITRLRGPQSHVPLSLDHVTPLADDGNYAVFRVNGAPVIVKNSGKVDDAGLPNCPTYASGLLSGRFLPAIAADLLSRGNPHKPFLHSQSHTPESFVAYLQHGTVLGKSHGDANGFVNHCGTPNSGSRITSSPVGVTPAMLPQRSGHAAKKLCSYFERDAQQRALEAYSTFVSESGWGIRDKMELYELSKRAFGSTVFPSAGIAAFEKIDADLRSHWGLGRNSSGPHWPAQKTFSVIKAEFSLFAWGDPVTLPHFDSDGDHVALLSGLRKMRGLKTIASYPVMAVSKFLHFYNPELFPIYDKTVIYDGVFVWFRNDFKEFCAKSGLQYEYEDTPLFLCKYIRWASSLLASAHSGFMEAFVDWLRTQPGAELQRRTFDVSTLYATAFEFTAIGAWCIERAAGR